MERSAHEDRISQLPDDIIHNILDRFRSPSTAAKTSILSRRWLHLWRTYPVLEFRDSDPQIQITELGAKFRSFAAASSRRLLPSLLLEAFKISFIKCPLARWVETLENYNLVNLSPIEIYISLPRQIPVISLDFCRTRVLKLYGINLDALKSCTNYGGMERLEVLCLHSVTIRSDNALNIFTSLCKAPNLATLSLVFNRSLQTRLEIASSKKLESIQICCGRDSPLGIHIISAPRLHALDAHVPADDRFKLTVESSSSAPKLKVLFLRFYKYSSGSTQSYLDHLLSNFPSLKSLALTIGSRGCSASSGMHSCLRVSSSSLGDLRISQSGHWWLAFHVDAPSLVTLHHSTLDAVCPVNKNTIHLVNVASSCQCVFELSSVEVRVRSIDNRWFLQLREFLATLTQSHPHLNLVLKLDTLHNLLQVTPIDSDQVVLSCLIWWFNGWSWPRMLGKDLM